jgi:hypothetical protein
VLLPPHILGAWRTQPFDAGGGSGLVPAVGACAPRATAPKLHRGDMLLQQQSPPPLVPASSRATRPTLTATMGMGQCRRTRGPGWQRPPILLALAVAIAGQVGDARAMAGGGPPEPPPPPCTKNCGQHGSKSSNTAPCDCNCNKGWREAACDHPTGCDGNPNCGHGSCVANGGDYSCTCQSGWSHPSSKRCDHPTGCDSKPCQNGGSCTPNGGDHTCRCAPCWTGSDCGQRPSCNTEPTASHAAVSCSKGKEYGSECTATCQPGYTKGNPGSKQSTCDCRQGRVVFNDFGLTCPPIPCSASRAPQDGSIQDGNKDRGLFPGRDITFVCNDGWYMSQAANGPPWKCRTSDGGYDIPTCTECSDVPRCPAGNPATHGGRGKRCTSASDQHCDKAQSCDTGYTQDVHCHPVSCPRDTHDGLVVHTVGWSLPKSTALPSKRPEQPRDTVADVPKSCGEDNRNLYDQGESRVPSKCAVQCRKGYTDSNFDSALVGPGSTQTYTCMPKQHSPDAPGGKWAGVALEKCTDTPWDGLTDVPLRCDPIDCGKFERPTAADWGIAGTSLGSFDPRQPGRADSTGKSHPVPTYNHDSAGSAQQLTREQLVAVSKDDFACTGLYSETGTTCEAQCMPSWYPTESSGQPDANSTIPSSLNGRRVQYVCTAPETGRNGTWVPKTADSKPLICKPGYLVVSNSEFRSNETEYAKPAQDWRRPLNSAGNFEGGDICQGFPNSDASHGCFDTHLLAPEKGPAIRFKVTAKDQRELPRNYDTLPRYEDERMQADVVQVEIRRVDLKWLDHNNRPLQPRQDHDTEDISNVDLRPYKEGDLSSEESKELGVDTPYANSKGANGQWEITHRFTEHGIFYISVYICEWKEKEKCYPSNTINRESYLVSGTGSTNNAPPGYMITVCPQNTEAETAQQNGILVGQRLNDCRAKSGFFSPKGPGHIAAACADGFMCTIRGMLWPVATADHFIDNENPTTMKKCLNKGACPGSDEFVKLSDCPSYYEGWETPDKYKGDDKIPYNVTKIDFPQPKQGSLHRGCFMKEGAEKVSTCSGSPCGITARSHKTGKPFLRQTCYAATGFRCCPGVTGAGCTDCCTLDQDQRYDTKNPSCNGRQWHSVGTGEGVHCEQCPPSGWRPEEHIPEVLFGLLIVVLCLPVIIALGELMKHAGAATGPVTSVIYFLRESVSTKARVWLCIFIWLITTTAARRVRGSFPRLGTALA